MFTAPDGERVPVERVALGPDRLAGLPAADGSGVLVPDDVQLAALVPGATAGLVVVDREDPGGGTALVTRVPVDRTHLVAAEAVVTATDGLRSAVAALRAEAAVIDALQSVGRRLTAQLDIDQLVQEATDAATTAVGAAFGAFFYNLINQFGESYTLYTLSGVPRRPSPASRCRATPRCSRRRSTARAPSAATTSPPTGASATTPRTTGCPRDTCP